MKPPPAVFQINDRWRLSEDDELQWILQQRRGKDWRSVAYCGSKVGLLEVALLHNRVAASRPVLAALERFPESYEVGALNVQVLDEAA